MRHPVRLLALLLALPVAAAFASADAGSDDTERNARLVEKYRRDDPAYYERLRRDLRTFYRLPAEKQERLRQLDRAMHEEDSTTQRRLWEVLDRFSAWLDRLPEEDRRRVEEAPNREERLRVIRELREQEFIRHLPKKVREELEQLPEEKRGDEIARLREDERALRLAWNPDGRLRSGVGPRTNRPLRPADLSAEAQTYLNTVLRPMLTDKDRTDLKAAEGKWPLFARTLLDLSERHLVELPGPSVGPSNAKELKGEYKAVYNKLTAKSGTAKSEVKNQLHQLEGKWPGFARALTQLAQKHSLAIKPFGPCRPEEFTPAVQKFITEELTPKLSDAEKDELKKSEGIWPEYPEKLLKLARDHNLFIPMMRLPGESELRDKLRNIAELPEVPNGTLREFLTELTPKERADLRLSLDDPESRDRLRKEYFNRNPKALNRLRDLDKRTLLTK